MMRHIVMFRRQADVPANPALEQQLVQGIHDLEGKIDFIRSWRGGGQRATTADLLGLHLGIGI